MEPGCGPGGCNVRFVELVFAPQTSCEFLFCFHVVLPHMLSEEVLFLHVHSLITCGFRRPLPSYEVICSYALTSLSHCSCLKAFNLDIH